MFPSLGRLRGLVAALLITTLSATNLFAEAWSLPADPAPNAVVPAPRERLQIPLAKPPRLVITPQHPSDYVLAVTLQGENEVISLSEGKVVGRIPSKLDSPRAEGLALSVDGTRAITPVRAFVSPEVDVWDITRGKLVHRLIPGGDARRLEFAEFVGNDRVVTCPGLEGKSSITVWDLATGDAVRTFLTPVDPSSDIVAVSPGGKYLAVAGRHKNLVLLYDLTGGKLLQQLSYATVSGGSWDDCQALAFGPDGSELAGLFNGKPCQLRVWHLPTGMPTVDAAITADPHANIHGRPSYNGRKFQWVPDGSGWLCYGYFWIDRGSQRIVRDLQVKVPHLMATIQPISPELVMFCRSDQRTGQLVTQPLAKLPTELMTAGEKPLWQTGDEVSLAVEIGPVRFAKPEAVEAAVRDALTQRVKDLGFTVADAAPVTMKVSYREEAGRVIPRPRMPEVPALPLPRPPQFGRGQRLGETGPGQGTGFLVSPQGHVVTCAHVVAKAPEVTVKLGARKVTAKVLVADEKSDLALLKFEAENEPFLSLRNSDEFELGEEVRAVGFPLSDVLGDSLKVTKGSLSGLIKRDDRKLFMIDASINPGNSGGPLIDQRGRVLGVNARLLVGPEIERVGMSLPINMVRPLCETHKVDLAAVVAEDTGLTGPDLLSRLEKTVAMILPLGATDPVANAISNEQATSTNIRCDLALVVQARETPLWTLSIADENRTFSIQRGVWNDEALRQSAVNQFQQRLKSLFLPYYVSADGSLQLPERVELQTTLSP